MNLFSLLESEWHPKSPEELLECPPTVFRAIDDGQAELLGNLFGIATVGEMVNHPVLDWVWRSYEVFRMGQHSGPASEADRYIRLDWRGRPCGEWMAGPLHSLESLSEEDGRQLAHIFSWVTIRNMATDTTFEAARVIHRMVDGKPHSPAEEITKPLPNFFEGASNSYMNRQREQSGRPPIPPPPPTAPRAVAELGAAPDLGAQNTTAGSAGEGTVGEGYKAEEPSRGAAVPSGPPSPLPGVFHAEPDTRGDRAWSEPPVESASYHQAFQGVPKTQRKDYTNNGTYIPQGGGSRGWFENQGVAKTERSNNYRYQEAIDQVGYRTVDVEHQIHINLRGAERKELRMQVRFSLDPHEVPQPALCLDVSLTGAKIRLGRRYRKDMPMFLSFVFRDDIKGFVTPLVDLEAQVAWCREVDPNFKRPRYDLGLAFSNVNIDIKERLSLLMMDRIEDLIATAPAPGE